MKFDELHSKIYKSLNQTVKKEIKTRFKKEFGLKISDKTVQRWFNEYETAPEKCHYLMLKCLSGAVILEHMQLSTNNDKYKNIVKKNSSIIKDFEIFLNEFVNYNASKHEHSS